jgi:DNA-binding GntR family transcriptional regulator
MSNLRRETLAQQAYEELQARIVSGRLPAGQRLLAEELAAQLDISQTPIKEALAELERDGLVVGCSRRGSSVRRFTPNDIADIYDARILIETNAIGAALRGGRIDAACLAALEATCAAQLAHAERRNPTDLAHAIRLDREFHEAIVSHGGNAVLAGLHRVLLRQTQTIRSYSLERYDVARFRTEHGAILAALRAGRVAGAVKALRTHLLASRTEMLSRPAADLPPRP